MVARGSCTAFSSKANNGVLINVFIAVHASFVKQLHYILTDRAVAPASEQDFIRVFSDEEFVNTLLQLETGERVRKALAEKGIVLSVDELDKFAAVLVEAIENKKGIEDVSGGVMSERSKEIEAGAKIFAEFIPENLKGNIKWLS